MGASRRPLHSLPVNWRRDGAQKERIFALMEGKMRFESLAR
jgi:hypothetical protein